MGQFGFNSYINEPTRQTVNSSSILDHIFFRTNNDFHMQLNINSMDFQTFLTDHFAAALSITPKNHKLNESQIKHKNCKF